MRAINNALLKLAKRAETHDRQHLIDSFVDVGPVFTLLSNPDNQIVFGRRGTGKTHVLGYLNNEIIKGGTVSVQLDMRTIGSTGGIYADTRLALAERATRLLVDTLQAIHEKILNEAIEREAQIDLSKLGPHLDAFADASSVVVVDGNVEIKEGDTDTSSKSSSFKFVFGAGSKGVKASADASAEDKVGFSHSLERKRNGVEKLRVHFSSVMREIQKVVDELPNKKLWILFDEWSEIPLDLQPYLADLLRRCVIPVRGVTIKIAAIEQRCQFRIPDEDIGHIGIEIGADAAASINLDEFLVFDNDTELSKKFFLDLLHRHVSALLAGDAIVKIPSTSSGFIGELFTQVTAFEEFVRAAEGVPRDAINIISLAAQKALSDKISVPIVRVAARTWYTRAKQQAVSTKPDAQKLLAWVIDEVIQHRKARAFLLEADSRDELIEFLYDARVLHLIKQSVSARDEPGRRYNVYSLDYGCYVELINTSSAPAGLFEVDLDEAPGYVDVPHTDYRSIRRAILKLDPFYKSLEQIESVQSLIQLG
ncbi:hypothetical protein [Pseudogulbenkiania sp. MAI-1]|uniref:ORC-CDC6 family AAA ATPase n=1 Tax=Pseudogulbenkiania sp. MAI-1 TaxID=990370 RepID=UPI0004BCA5BA|nr:hypothetical protein [Pseudogulbenkiania sp. MAI-1]